MKSRQAPCRIHTAALSENGSAAVGRIEQLPGSLWTSAALDANQVGYFEIWLYPESLVHGIGPS